MKFELENLETGVKCGKSCERGLRRHLGSDVVFCLQIKNCQPWQQGLVFGRVTAGGRVASIRWQVPYNEGADGGNKRLGFEVSCLNGQTVLGQMAVKANKSQARRKNASLPFSLMIDKTGNLGFKA